MESNPFLATNRTLTRSYPQGEVGFLSDIHCMNVGMAHAHPFISSPTLSFPHQPCHSHTNPVIPAPTLSFPRMRESMAYRLSGASCC
jgi:hypothetical protein